jgi:hypothetical protein
MAQAGSLATKSLFSLLTSLQGVPATISEIADLDSVQPPVFNAAQVTVENVSNEILERSKAVQYPSLNMYCASVKNLQREKFRTFSGEANMVVETRISQDRVDGLETVSQMYVDAVTMVLDQNRGDWGNGVSYNGGYEVNYGPVKHGGRNFLQTAKISFSVDVSEE